MGGVTRRTAALAITAGVAAACVDQSAAPLYAGKLGFRHGVASGDPTADRVVIWTRVTPDGGGVVPVRWIVARDEGLGAIVRSGEVQAKPEADYTVKVDVDGLSPGQRYFFGFLAGSERSPVGRTRTLPGAGVAEVKLAVASCASFSHGFFNAYEAIAKRGDVDFVIHLGNYIFEDGLSGYGGEEALALARLPRPNIECVTLEDYRARHAQFKEEPELQAAHAATPWFVIWDDHEIAAGANATGAANHQRDDGEGEWTARKALALQAYYEWMPIRDPAANVARENAWRSADFGDLATLMILETRLTARAPQFDFRRDVKPISALWDFKDKDAPTLVPAGAIRPLDAREIPTPFDISTTPPTPITDWRRIRALDPKKPPFGIAYLPDLDALRARLADQSRSMLGAEQEQWLLREIARSRTTGAPWQVLANQTLFAPVTAPDMSRRLGPEALAALEKRRPGGTEFLDLTRFGVPLSLDSWDGYPGARERLLAALSGADANTLVLTGDSRGAWVNAIHAGDGATVLAVEFGATSVTAPGLGDDLANAPFNLDEMLVAANKSVVWTDQTHRGFMVVTLRRDEAVAEHFAVSSVTSKDYSVDRLVAYRTTPTQRPGLTKPAPVTP